MQCPICKKHVAEGGPEKPATFPFCSQRCKLIDLGRWLDGKYQIPLDEPNSRTDTTEETTHDQDDKPPAGDG